MITKRDKEEALKAFSEGTDWTGAEVVERTREPMVLQSVRLPRHLTERLLAEATRRGVTPSDVIRDLVEAGLNEADASATVKLSDVTAAIAAVARRAA